MDENETEAGPPEEVELEFEEEIPSEKNADLIMGVRVLPWRHICPVNVATTDQSRRTKAASSPSEASSCSIYRSHIFIASLSRSL
jgi:hypothetical protein